MVLPSYGISIVLSGQMVLVGCTTAYCQLKCCWYEIPLCTVSREALQMQR